MQVDVLVGQGDFIIVVGYVPLHNCIIFKIWWRTGLMGGIDWSSKFEVDNDSMPEAYVDSGSLD